MPVKFLTLSPLVITSHHFEQSSGICFGCCIKNLCHHDVAAFVACAWLLCKAGNEHAVFSADGGYYRGK